MNTNVKLKRILSLALSLCMVLSYDVPIYAADGVVRTYEYTPETCPGHVYTELVEVMEEPTCTEAGIGIYACGKCGYVAEYEGIGEAPALGHDLHVDRVEATCTEDGSITTTCTRGDYHKVEPIPANGQHDFDETEKVEVSAASCTEPQKIGYKCKNCEAFQEDSIEERGDALGHNVADAAEETVPATCMHGGYTYKICRDCGEEVIQSESGDPDLNNHEYEDELSVISEATCHQGEVRAKKCKNPECDAYDEDSKVVGEDLNPENHEWTEKTLPAGCENNAKVVKVCQYHEDAEEFVKDLYQESVDNGEEDATLKAKGHTEKTIPAEEATCKDPGKTAGKECLVCGDVLVEQTEVEADASKHVYEGEPEVLKAETCSKPGAGKYTCIVCGDTVYKAIPARHIYDKDIIIKGATCTEPGEKAQICNREGGCTNPSDPDSAKTVVIPATGHDWDDGTETEQATCTKAGEKTFTCNHCGKTSTTVIPMVEHSYVEEVISATCDHPAQKGFVCSVCKTVKPGTTPVDIEEGGEGYEEQLEHSYVKDEEQSENPKCGKAGVSVMICEHCGHIESETEPALSHVFVKDGNDEVLKETPPNCTEAGKWTKHCTLCNNDIELTAEEYETAGKEARPATNHANAEAKEKIPATCQEVGHEAGSYCADCERYIDGGEEIPVDTTNGHNWQMDGTPLKEATCTKEGVSKYVCQNAGCTATKYDKIPKTHAWGAFTETKAATCEAAGKQTRTCSLCDETESEEIPPLGHDWGEWQTVEAATCGAAGKERRVCTHNSEHVDDKDIQATDAHNKEYQVIAADCEHPTRVGIYCNDCHQIFEDALEVTEENKPAIIAGYKQENGMPADGETLSTEEEKKLAAFEALLVPQPALGHDMEGAEIEIVDSATCTEAGAGKKKCKRDGCDHEEDVVIPATGHEITGDYHEPTCNENGKIISTCSNCDYNYEMDLYKAWGDESEKATGHNYQLTEALKPATCTSTGIGKFVCADCEESKYDVIPKTHAYDEGVVSQEATCTTDGERLYTCSECEDTETVVIPATGHNYGESEFLEATCTEPARVGRKCTNEGCGALIAVVVVTNDNKEALAEELGTEVEPEEARRHIWERTLAAEPTETKAATCTEDGEKIWRCVCGEEHTETITASGHSWTEVYEEADCTHAGRVKKTCSICGEIEYDEETFAEIDPQLDHSWEDVEEVPATCIAAGTSAGKVCTVCGTFEGCDEIPVDTEHGHAWDEGVEDGENICENGGTLVRTCTLCDEETPNHTTEEPIEAGHKWVRKTLKDEETGKTMAIVKGCDRCNAIDEYLYMPKGYGVCPEHGLVAIPEDFVIPAVPATCTDTGWSEGRKCPQCGEVILEPKEVPATGHTFKEEKTLEEPTCSKPGSKVKVCNVCGEDYDEEEIPATGEHDYVDTLVEGTCHTNAAVKHLCKDCGTEDPEHPAEEIPGTMDENAHTYDGTECTQCHVPMPEGYAYCEEHGWVAAIVVPGTAATCTAAGLTDGLKCPTCETVIKAQEEIPMTDHAYDWVVMTPATCIDAGTKVEICSVCEQEGETEEIPATGEHNYSVDGWIEATCSENGYVTHSCSGCGLEDESAREEVPGTMDPDNHTYEEEETPATCTENKKISYVCSGCGQADPDRPETEVPGTAGHVFVDGTCEVCGIKNATAVTSGSTSAVDGNNKVTLSSDISVAETDVEIVEIGVLYITSKDYDGDAASDLFFTLAEDGTYTIGNPSVRVERYTSSNADLESYMNVYVTINLGTSEANTTRTLYGRGYVIVKKDGKYSVQFDSNVIQGTYAGGFNAA